MLVPLFHARLEEEGDGRGSWVSATPRAASEWRGGNAGSARLQEALCAWHLARERALLAACGELVTREEAWPSQQAGPGVTPPVAVNSDGPAGEQRAQVSARDSG